MARNALKDIVADAVSDTVVIDFSEAREGGFEPLEPGPYQVTVASCTPGISKPKPGKKEGNPKLVIVFELDEPIDGFTKTVYKHCPTKGEGSGILRDVLRGLGFDVENLPVPFDPETVVGRQAIITVKYQKDRPEFNEITKVQPIPGKRTTTRRRASSLA